MESQFYEFVQHLRNRTISRAGKIAARPIFDVRNSMIQTVYQISFVGADDSVRPLKSCNFVRSFVGADAHIGPLKCCDFASDFRKNGQFRRADRVVRPYDAKTKPCTITPVRPYAVCFRFGVGRCRHRPLRGEKRNPLRFIVAVCRGESGLGCKTKILRLRYPDSRRILRFPR